MAGRPRSEKHDQAILEAAAELIGELSYKAVSIEAIAARANVGKQTIYRRWSDKVSLYLALYKKLVPAQVTPADQGDVCEDLRHIFHQRFTLYSETPAAKILVGLISEMPENGKVRETMQNAFVPERKKILIDVIERGQARGQLMANANPDHIADTITALIWMRLLNAPESLDGAAVDYVLDRAVRPFLTSEGAASVLTTEPRLD